MPDDHEFTGEYDDETFAEPQRRSPRDPIKPVLPPMVTRGEAEEAIRADAKGGSLRDRIVPMIASAIHRYPPVGLDITGWDFVIIPSGGGLVAGIAMACRGHDLIGPGKELCQFVTLPTWSPSQQQVDEIVQILGNGLRDYRDQQKGMLAR